MVYISIYVYIRQHILYVYNFWTINTDDSVPIMAAEKKKAYCKMCGKLFTLCFYAVNLLGFLDSHLF